jgi:hypothetical protein
MLAQCVCVCVCVCVCAWVRVVCVCVCVCARVFVLRVVYMFDTQLTLCWAREVSAMNLSRSKVKVNARPRLTQTHQRREWNNAIDFFPTVLRHVPVITMRNAPIVWCGLGWSWKQNKTKCQQKRLIQFCDAQNITRTQAQTLALPPGVFVWTNLTITVK